MAEGSGGSWWAGAIATATSVWQAFVIPIGLAGWAVYKSTVGRADTRRVTEADRAAAYMNRLEARIVTQDAENLALRRELDETRAANGQETARLINATGARYSAEYRDKMRRWDLARSWWQECQDLRHDFANVAQQRGIDWTPPDLPGLEDLLPRAPITKDPSS